jgi:membrane protein DedA with SNARE-associated domain
MNFSWLPTGAIDQVIAFTRDNMAWIEPIVFALGFAESIAFLALFVPSTVLFLAIGGLHSAAGGEFWTTWLAGASGAFLGDVVSYAMGRWFKDDLGSVWPFRRNADWYVLTVRFFERWGLYSIVGGKFLGFMRPFIPVVAGALHMRWGPFLFGSALSCLMWAGVFLAPGYGLLHLAR